MIAAAVGSTGLAVAETLPQEFTVGDQALHKLLGAGAQTVRLWPGEAPDEVRPNGEKKVVPNVRKNCLLSVQRVTVPTMTLSFPPNHAKPAARVVICLGGGDGGLGIESEAAEITNGPTPAASSARC